MSQADSTAEAGQAKTVSVRLPGRLAAELERELEKTGESRSELIRDAIWTELKRRIEQRLEDYYASLDHEEEVAIAEEDLSDWVKHLEPYEWETEPDLTEEE